MVSDIFSSLLYIRRLDEYKSVKPYMITFDVAEFGQDVEQTNLQLEPRPTRLRDIKTSDQKFDINVNGFEMGHFPSSILSSQACEDDSFVRDHYYQEVVRFLQTRFGPELEGVHVMTHKLRRRSPQFPALVVEDIKTLQPINKAHADYSPGGASPQLRGFLELNQHLRGLPYKIINVWRVLHGPNRDWPLALCDHTTLDLQDVEVIDYVGREHVTEGLEICHNPNQIWYFVDHQLPEEVVMFCNTDSRSLEIPFSAHAAFEHTPDEEPRKPRESLEVRVACFFKQPAS